jgi:hypothetical protein
MMKSEKAKESAKRSSCPIILTGAKKSLPAQIV